MNLLLNNIRKHFGEVVALAGASLVVRAGTVHALLGENGAGKTTLMRVAYGLLRPDAGEVRVDGEPRAFSSPADAIAAGIGMVQQQFALVQAMSVAENVALGRRGRYRAGEAAERVRRIAREAGLALDPEARAGELPVGAQQRLEIVKALARDARVLILDEPTAVLAPAEAADLLRWLRAFADSGRSVVLITHKLREALAISDDVTVLRRGATVATLAAAGASEDALARAMLGAGGAEGGEGTEGTIGARRGGARVSGTAVDVVIGRGAPPQHQYESDRRDEHHRTVATRTGSLPDRGALGAVVIRTVGLAVADERGVVRVRDVSCELRAGEIVGVAGVEGAGQRELLHALAGRRAPAAGTIELPAEGVGFVPEDRRRDALIPEWSLTENVALRGAGRRRGRISWRRMRELTRDLLARYDIRAPAGEATAAGTLSGGNQQRLVIARELAAAPALIVESPTQGLDVRASAAVHERLRAARDAGAAVVVYSADLDEVLALADRVLVAHAGRVREVPNDRDAVGRAMLGV